MTRDDVRAAVAQMVKAEIRTQLPQALVLMRLKGVLADAPLDQEEARKVHPFIKWMIDQGAWEGAMQNVNQHRWLDSLVERLAFDICLRIAEEKRTLVVIRDALGMPQP